MASFHAKERVLQFSNKETNLSFDFFRREEKQREFFAEVLIAATFTAKKTQESVEQINKYLRVPYGPYHGLIWMSSSLEFQVSIGISWVCLGVFTDRPFLWLSFHLLCFFFIFISCYTWRRWNMLVNELATAAPGS